MSRRAWHRCRLVDPVADNGTATGERSSSTHEALAREVSCDHNSAHPSREPCPIFEPVRLTTVLGFDNSFDKSFDNNAYGRRWLRRHAVDDSANTICGASA